MAATAVPDAINSTERSREEAEERGHADRTLALAGELVARINDLNARVNDLEAWTGEVADDMLDRTQRQTL